MTSKKLLLFAVVYGFIETSGGSMAARVGDNAEPAASGAAVIEAPEPEAFGAGSQADAGDGDAGPESARYVTGAIPRLGQQQGYLSELDHELRIQAILAGYSVGASVRTWPGFHTGMTATQFNAPNFAGLGAPGGNWMNNYLSQAHGNGRGGRVEYFSAARQGYAAARSGRYSENAQRIDYESSWNQLDDLAGDPGYTKSTVISAVAEALKYFGEFMRDALGMESAARQVE